MVLFIQDGELERDVARLKGFLKYFYVTIILI